MRKVYTIGEITYDIIFKDGMPFESKPGGSVLNSSISLGRLGLPIFFVAQCGDDQIGEMSIQFIENNNVHCEYITRYKGNTRISLAFLDEQNNAQYQFYPAGGISKTIFPKVNSNDIIIFGSSFAYKDENREELVQFLQESKEKGAIIVYDPNFRKNSLNKLSSYLPHIKENITLSSLIKASDEDIQLIFNTATPEEAYTQIERINPIPFICTANKKGVWYCNGKQIKHYSVPEIIPVSTIGAGDTFNAGIVYGIFKQGILSQHLNKMQVELWDQVIQQSIIFSQRVCMLYDNYLDESFIKDNQLIIN